MLPSLYTLALFITIRTRRMAHGDRPAVVFGSASPLQSIKLNALSKLSANASGSGSGSLGQPRAAPSRREDEHARVAYNVERVVELDDREFELDTVKSPFSGQHRPDLERDGSDRNVSP